MTFPESVQGVLVVGGAALVALAALFGGMQWLRWYVDFKRSLDLVFLQILIPKKDSKEDRETDQEQFGSGKDFQKITGVMVHLLQNLQVIFSSKLKYKLIGQEFFSFEIAVLEGEIYFFIVVPRQFVYAIEKQIASFYESAVIEQVDDYALFKQGQSFTGCELVTTAENGAPLNTFRNLQSETMNPILGALAKIGRDEGAAVQIMLRPVSGWQGKAQEFATKLLNPDAGGGGVTWWNPFAWVWAGVRFLVGSGGKDEEKKGPGQLSQNVQDTAKLAADKAQFAGYDTVIRLVASSTNPAKAGSIIQALLASMQQFNANAGNGLTDTEHHSVPKLIKNFIFRSFQRSWASTLFMWRRFEREMILGSEEIASLYHFPHIRYNTITGIKWQDFKIEPAPANLPKEGTLLGTNTYRGDKREVRIERNDRRRHFYIIGKSGTGKSTLLETMIKQDFANGEGVCVIDPHGDLVEAVLPYIPRSRADDVIVFDPGDVSRPMGLNILEGKTPDEREFMAQEALAIFIKMYGEEIMGPRLQDYFRNGCLTLMEDLEEGAALIDLTRLFTDEAYQKYKVSKVTNPIVKGFWTKQMANTGQREKQEIIPYFASKFGPFVTNGIIRNVIGQVKSSFNIREIMDQRKILLCNLSKGKLGEINSQLLGSILVTKIQQAAMSRVDTPENDRPDFYFYVDEFQNFVTESFASILSEARKYRLNLIVAHQYISQITKMSGGGKGSHEDTTIRDAVFGNVGSMLCFKIGAADAETMAKEFAPVFSDQDLVNIANYRAYVKLNVKGTTSRGFSLETIYDLTGKDTAAAEAYRQLSRLKYGRDRDFVEAEIFKRVG